jgi:hypothetical protein
MSMTASPIIPRLAVELHPGAGRARRYCEALQGKGILAKDTHEHTIRVAPPLVITSDQVDWALERFATIAGFLLRRPAAEDRNAGRGQQRPFRHLCAES